MKKRVFENPITSIIGVMLLMGTIVAVITKVATWDQGLLMLPTCFGLIWVKDTVIEVDPK